MDSNDNQNTKIWEKPWSIDEIKNSAGLWSLAADSGLLLSLKQFSETITQKSAELENSLNNLNFMEKQCETKLNNTTGEFLMLANTQFIENRVYDEDVSQVKDKESKRDEVKEKTKEEKETELLVKINEAVNIGMSIMDKYFMKIENTNKEKDDTEDEDIEENEEDIDIYEVKDPYVLRNLPHLIGSAAYLEDDHVGLIDYEDEEEAKEEDQEEIEEKSETSTEEEEDDEEEEGEDSIEPVQKNIGGLSLANGLLHANEDDEEESDLFKASNFKQKSNLFDDSESEKNENESETEEPINQTNQTNLIKKEEIQSKPMDLASELAAKLAKKTSAKSNTEVTEPTVSNIIQEPAQTSNTPKEQFNKPTKSLFDDSDESENDDLFEATKPTNVESKAKSLFDNVEEENEDIFENKEVEKTDLKTTVEVPTEKPKPNLPSGAKSIFGGNLQSDLKKQLKVRSGLFDSSEDEQENEKEPEPLQEPKKDESKPQPSTDQKVTLSKTDNKKNISLFDDDEDKDDDLFSSAKKLPQSNQLVKKPASLFDDDSEDAQIEKETKVTQKQINESSKTKYNKSLFDDEEDDLFESGKKTEISKTAIVKEVSKTKSLFDDDDDDKEVPIIPTNTIGYSDPKNEIQKRVPLLKEEGLEKTSQSVETTKPTNETQKKSMFSSDEDELFSSSKKPLIVNKNQQNDNLFAELSKKMEKPIDKPVAKSIFSESEEDDLFKSKDKISVPSKNTIDSTNKVKDNIIIQSTRIEVNPLESNKQKNPLLNDISDNDEDLFASKPKLKEPEVSQKNIEKEEKPKLPSDSNEDDDIFFANKKNLNKEQNKETTLPIKSKNPQFDSNEDDDDIFTSKSKIESKEVLKVSKVDDLNVSKIPQNIEANPSKVNSPSPITFPPSDNESNSDTDDLFTPKTKVEAQKESPENKISKLNDKITINPAALIPGERPTPKQNIKENEPNEEKPIESSESVVKNIRNSAFINPAALLPGARPTLPRQTKQNDFSTDGHNEEKSSEEIKTIRDQNDLFDLDVDRTFNDQSVRSVQKDRLKVAQKKRPPTNRRSNINENSDLFGNEPSEPKSEINQLKTEEPKIIPSKELSSIISDEDDFLKAKDNQKPQQQKNNLDSIFADDTDLFADSSLFAKPPKKTAEPAKEIKKPKIKVELDDDIFDEELFKPKKKDSKNSKTTPKKIEDDIFDDPLS